MLLLDRKVGQAIRIDGGIMVEVVRIAGGHVKLGVTAPGPVRVLRGELAERGPGERLPSVARRVVGNGKISR